ncbi:hypothetical protein [Nocardioides sp. LML1-1-1.1]|uniref:hypothetical protein n=1 Tax=Nocardioides sp. LML1-1-1.1 TaxID=3135248 RepID=UPI003418D3C4
MLVSRGGRALVAALALAAAPIVLPGPPAAFAAEDPECASIGPDDTDRRKVAGPNFASEELRIPAATALAAAAGRKPGKGVRIYLVDTALPAGPAAYADAPSNHALVAAGILAGGAQEDPAVEVGIAPAADVTPVKFYDAPDGQAKDGEKPPTPEGLTSALGRITVKPRDRAIVLIPAAVRGTAALEAQLDRLHAEGALLIAPVGDRPQAKTGFLQDYAGKPRAGEDAAADVWPAADEDVVAVGISTPGAAGVALRSSGVDLAAPGVGSISIGLQGGWCLVADPSSAWAAAPGRRRRRAGLVGAQRRQRRPAPCPAGGHRQRQRGRQPADGSRRRPGGRGDPATRGGAGRREPRHHRRTPRRGAARTGRPARRHSQGRGLVGPGGWRRARRAAGAAPGARPPPALT